MQVRKGGRKEGGITRDGEEEKGRVQEEDKSSGLHSVADKLCGIAPGLPRLLRVTFLRKIGPMEVS